MRILNDRLASSPWFQRQAGKVGYAVAWLLGVPLPLLFLVYLLRGCE